MLALTIVQLADAVKPDFESGTDGTVAQMRLQCLSTHTVDGHDAVAKEIKDVSTCRGGALP
jgi:hypothetical protein